MPGRQHEVAVGQAAALFEQHVALFEIDAGAPDMPAAFRRLGDGDAIAVAGGVFLDDDGVGPAGQDAAGENAGTFAGADFLWKWVPGGCFAHYF